MLEIHEKYFFILTQRRKEAQSFLGVYATPFAKSSLRYFATLREIKLYPEFSFMQGKLILLTCVNPYVNT
jgi:hypothetical protein